MKISNHTSKNNSNKCYLCSQNEEEIKILKQTINEKNQYLQKLQSIISRYGLSISNDTSSSFLLPSEFKSQWENFTNNTLIESFENTYDDPHIVSFLSQETIKLLYKTVYNDIQEKVRKIMEILNIPNNEKESINTFFYKIRFIFQEYFSSIFMFSEHEKIINKLSLIHFNINRKEDLMNDLKSNQFKKFINEGYKLCSYMNLHSPVLTLKGNEFVYLFYSKRHHNNIEGFGKDNSVCLVTMFPPMLNKTFFYQGIKPTVYIISNPSEEMIQECENNKILYDFGEKNRSCSETDIKRTDPPNKEEDGNLLKNYKNSENTISNIKSSRSKSSNLYKEDIKNHNKHNNNKAKLFSLFFNSKNNEDLKLNSIIAIKKNFDTKIKPQKSIHTIQVEKNIKQVYFEESFKNKTINTNENNEKDNIKKVVSKNNNFSYLKINFEQKKSGSKFGNTSNSMNDSLSNTSKLIFSKSSNDSDVITKQKLSSIPMNRRSQRTYIPKHKKISLSKKQFSEQTSSFEIFN